MPDPSRLARRSINLMVRLGMTRAEAALAVMDCAERVIMASPDLPAISADWLTEIYLAAQRSHFRARARRPQFEIHPSKLSEGE